LGGRGNKSLAILASDLFTTLIRNSLTIFVHDRFTLPPARNGHAHRPDREFHAVSGIGGNWHPDGIALDLTRPDVTINPAACADPLAEAGSPAPRAPSTGTPAVSARDIVCSLVGSAIAEVERELILQTLTRTRGNRTRAAGMLGISIRTLRNKIREYHAGGVAVMQPAGRGASTAVARGACD
jgi:Bacterial regulatory protein, Fis family